MSIQVSAYLVDWDEIVERYRRRKESPRWFFESIEDREEWVEQYRPDGWIESWNAAVDAGLFYDNAREELSRTARKPFDKFLRNFLASREKHQMRVRELAGAETDDGVFEVTMSPATVKNAECQLQIE
jgi:hypothetical protein